MAVAAAQLRVNFDIKYDFIFTLSSSGRSRLGWDCPIQVRCRFSYSYRKWNDIIPRHGTNGWVITLEMIGPSRSASAGRDALTRVRRCTFRIVLVVSSALARIQ